MQLTQHNPFGSEFPPFKNPLSRLKSLTVSSVVATTRPMFHCLTPFVATSMMKTVNGLPLGIWGVCGRGQSWNLQFLHCLFKSFAHSSRPWSWCQRRQKWPWARWHVKCTCWVPWSASWGTSSSAPHSQWGWWGWSQDHLPFWQRGFLSSHR